MSCNLVQCSMLDTYRSYDMLHKTGIHHRNSSYSMFDRYWLLGSYSMPGMYRNSGRLYRFECPFRLSTLPLHQDLGFPLDSVEGFPPDNSEGSSSLWEIPQDNSPRIPSVPW